MASIGNLVGGANLGIQGTYGNSSAGSISQGGGYNVSDSWGENYGSSWGYESGSSHSAQQSISEWGGYANGESYGQTFGREASAQDIMNAYTANNVERELWAMQAAYNAHEAEKSRQFQAQMSNTAYQRAVEDLKKAGLNPILAAGAAAATPVGATASSGLSSAHKANAFAESVSHSKNSSYEGGYSKSSGYSNSSYNGKSGSESYGKSGSHSYGMNQNSARSWEESSYNNNVKGIVDSVAAAGGTAVNAMTNLMKWKYEQSQKGGSGGKY